MTTKALAYKLEALVELVDRLTVESAAHLRRIGELQVQLDRLRTGGKHSGQKTMDGSTA